MYILTNIFSFYLYAAQIAVVWAGSESPFRAGCFGARRLHGGFGFHVKKAMKGYCQAEAVMSQRDCVLGPWLGQALWEVLQVHAPTGWLQKRQEGLFLLSVPPAPSTEQAWLTSCSTQGNAYKNSVVDHRAYNRRVYLELRSDKLIANTVFFKEYSFVQLIGYYLGWGREGKTEVDWSHSPQLRVGLRVSWKGWTLSRRSLRECVLCTRMKWKNLSVSFSLELKPCVSSLPTCMGLLHSLDTIIFSVVRPFFRALKKIVTSS